jgi:hypothetical protein
MSVAFHRTVRRYIPQSIALHGQSLWEPQIQHSLNFFCLSWLKFALVNGAPCSSFLVCFQRLVLSGLDWCILICANCVPVRGDIGRFGSWPKFRELGRMCWERNGERKNEYIQNVKR